MSTVQTGRIVVETKDDAIRRVRVKFDGPLPANVEPLPDESGSTYPPTGFEPRRVLISYVRDGLTEGSWWVGVNIYGPLLNDRLRRGRLVVPARDPKTGTPAAELDWPKWLLDLVERHHPDRPDDDPEGSYL